MYVGFWGVCGGVGMYWIWECMWGCGVYVGMECMGVGVYVGVGLYGVWECMSCSKMRLFELFSYTLMMTRL